MTSPLPWIDLLALVVAVLSLGVTVAIFLLGKRLSFQQQRERERQLRTKAWEVLQPIRTRGMNSKVIVMNVERYKRGYDGSNDLTWRGYAFTGPELIEVGHSGVEVIIRGIESYYDPSGARTLETTPKRAPSVIEAGHIPWAWIEDIDPAGDEYDGSAIFFVRHLAPGREPYDYRTYREGQSEPFGPNHRPCYAQVPALHTRHPRPVRDWHAFAKNWSRDREMRKRMRDAFDR